MMNMTKRCVVAMIGICLGCHAHAENYAIVNAMAHTLSDAGSLQNATILIKDGKIEQVGADISVPADYIKISADGKPVTPGLIGAMTSLGLVEVSSSAGTVDAESEAFDLSPTGAALDVSYAINSGSTLIPISRIEGVTLAATAMQSTDSLFGGLGAIIRLDDDASLVEPRAFMMTGVDDQAAETNGGSRAATFVALKLALDEAKYARSAKLNPTVAWHGLTSVADAKALIPVIKGDIPLLVTVHRAADILRVIALKQEYKALELVLLNATEGWKVAEEIAQAQIPVILDPEINLPYTFDSVGATMANAGLLHKAGVKVSIGMNTHNIRLATQHAGNAVANGLPWIEGLASLTINPANLYGIEQQYGSIEKGKVADLVIWSGDPLEVTETAEKVMIGGEWIEMESRQTKLRDRYLHINTEKPAQFTRP
jgi:imidazolonepropionase-like amidohydrolase